MDQSTLLFSFRRVGRLALATRTYVLHRAHTSPRALLIFAGAIGLAAAAVVAGSREPRASIAAPQSKPLAPALTVTTAEVQAGEVVRTLELNGSMHAWQEIVIGSEVGGYRVDRVHVEVGDRVKRGQELVRLSASLLEAEVDVRRAALKQAQAQWSNAQSAYRRAQTIAQSGLITGADLDRLQSEELAAASRADAAQAELKAAELRLQYTHVVAPDDGVITSRVVNVGQVAQAGAEMLRILRQDRIEWRGDAPEGRLHELQAGQTVQLTTASGESLAGTVRVVAPIVQSANRMGTVYVDIARRGAAQPGMFARGRIEVGRANALLAPFASVVVQDGYSFLFALRPDGLVERRRVQTGAVQGEAIELLSGVAAGERVVAQGAGFLRDGDRVRVVSRDARLTAG